MAEIPTRSKRMTDRDNFLVNHPPRIYIDTGLRRHPERYCSMLQPIKIEKDFSRLVTLKDIVNEATQFDNSSSIMTIGQLFALGLTLTEGSGEVTLEQFRQLQDEFNQTGELTLTVFDMDLMRSANEAFSHYHGSLICSYFAQNLIDLAKRMNGLVAIEGEENILVTPYSVRDTLPQIYDFLHTFSNMGFRFDGQPFRQGVTAGISSLSQTKDQSFWRLMELAGAALVHGKKLGKHKIAVFGDPIDVGDWVNFLFEKQLKVYEKFHLPSEEETKREAEFVLAFSELKPHSKIIDAMCGSGRHVKAFVNKGHEVVGIDKSHSAIQAARMQAQIEHSSRLFRSDIRTFYRTHSDLIGASDLVTCMYSSLGYDDDDIKTLVGIHKLVKEGGLFFLDIPNKVHILNDFEHESTFRDDNDETITVKRKYDNQTSRVHTITLKGSATLFEIDMKLYSLSEITQLLQETEFEVEKVAADFSGTVFDYQNEASNSRLLILARKKP